MKRLIKSFQPLTLSINFDVFRTNRGRDPVRIRDQQTGTLHQTE